VLNVETVPYVNL